MQELSNEGDRELRQLEDEADLAHIIAGFQGRRFLRRLLQETGAMQATFTGDALTSAFREGQRNIGLKLLAKIQEATPEKLALILLGEDYDGHNLDDHD